MISLGNWQLRRLDWKLDLIERVESRAYADAIAAPSQSSWADITTDTHEYLRIITRGQYVHDKETLIWAATEHGNGYWVLTPLINNSDETVLINRGYVPIDAANQENRVDSLPAGDIEVTGLLRLSEPDGIPLRDNDPANDRWYSRDVEAIANKRGLVNVAPYFIDADATASPDDLPIGGMTKLNFRNPHLVYALTWYALALLLVVMTVWVIWIERHKK